MRQNAASGRSTQVKSGVPSEGRLTSSGLLIGAYLAVFLCQFDLCMLQQGRIQFAPVYPLLVSLAAFAVTVSYLVPGQIVQIAKRSGEAVFAFGLIAFLALAGAALPKAYLAENWKFIFFPTVDFLVFLLALPLGVLFSPQANWRVACGMALCALVSSILIDARYPGTFSLLDTRAAGFAVNPNGGAATSVMLLIGLLDWRRPSLSRIACMWLALTFVGVFLTLSRSGILVLGIVSALYVRLCVRRNGMGTVVILAGLAFCVVSYVGIASDAAKQLLPMLNSEHSRSNLFSGQLDAMETQEDSRVLLVYEYLGMIAERPILGWGTGLNSDEDGLGVHNMFLARWVENGLPGLGAYLMLIYALFRVGIRCQSWECIALSIYLVAISFFSHNLLEDKPLTLMMAICTSRAILNAPQPIGLVNAIWGKSKMSYPRSAELEQVA